MMVKQGWFKSVVMMMVLIMTFSACGSKGESGAEGDDSSQGETQGTEESGDSNDLMTIEIYDVAANYQGIQTGWFGKIVKDKFNLELNIIAPQVSGDGEALYQTRSSAGDLGDIVLLDNADLQDCIESGLIKDITQEMQSTTYLKEYLPQYQLFNEALKGNEEGRIYGLPCQITNTSPTTYSETEVYSSPMVPWDYYTELGRPEVKDLEGLLDLMELLQDTYPTNEAGDPNYALSLWDDWDGTSIETVNQITKWYGDEVLGSILLSNKGEMKPLTDDAGTYHKMLKFFYEANQRGLIDPDSGTQDWDAASTKMKNKQVLLHWYIWQRGFWNTPERAQERNAYIAVPVGDMNVYQASDTYYGDGRAFAVGSQVTEEEKTRIMEFMDWLISPEGLDYLHAGLEGYNYTVNDDGTYTLTEDGKYALMENREVPEEFGGGGFSDGMSQINQWPMAGVSINPNTGESYMKDYWSSYLEENRTTMTKEWSEAYGAENQVDYLQQVGQLQVIPSVNIILPSDSTDIALIRSQCGDIICDTSWQMIFAKDENEFEERWSSMKTTLEGLGWETLVAFDTDKYQRVVDARAAAMGQ